MSPRRSGRSNNGTHPDAMYTESSIQGENPRKRQRKTKDMDPLEVQKRGRGGKLKKLTEMPLDILFEIFGELNPLDVLHLARSSKSLRGILLHRSAISIWKKALSNISGLPACPSNISQPFYTNLAFDRHCHFCATSTQDVYWEYHVRCCTNCFNGKFSRNPLWSKSSATRELITQAYDLLPVVVDKTQKQRQMAYVRPNKEALCLFERLIDMQNDASLKQFVEEQQSHVKQLKAYAGLCYKWQERVNQQRAFELDEIRMRRKEAIITKLTELGWGDEIDRERGSYRRRRTLLVNHPLVRQPKELTERIWNNIKPALVEVLVNKRAERLKKEWAVQVSKRIRMTINAVTAYIRPRHTDQWFPNSVDFCLTDEFRVLIMDPSPDDSTITEASFKAIESCIPDAANKWRLSQDRSLLEILPDAGSWPVEDMGSQTFNTPTRLELATTFFLCKTCLGRDTVHVNKTKSTKKKVSHPIGYPRILVHQCLNNRRSPLSDDPNFEILSKLAPMREQPWNVGGDQVRFYTVASNIAHNIVTACGKDPAITTASEMDEQDVRVECGRCSNGTNSRLIMTWRMAICHSIDCHSEKKGGSRSWKLLDANDAQRARALEAVQFKDGKHQLSKDFRCTLCSVLLSRAGLSEHLRYYHSILRDPEESDFSKDRDVPMYRPPFPVRLDAGDTGTSSEIRS